MLLEMIVVVFYDLLSRSSLTGQVGHMSLDTQLPLIHSRLQDSKTTSFSYHLGGLNLIMQGTLLEVLQMKSLL